MKCGKVTHKDKLGAIIHAKRLKNNQMNTYYCKACKGWHIGHSGAPHRKMDRINQLLDRVL